MTRSQPGASWLVCSSARVLQLVLSRDSLHVIRSTRHGPGSERDARECNCTVLCPGASRGNVSDVNVHAIALTRISLYIFSSKNVRQTSTHVSARLLPLVIVVVSHSGNQKFHLTLRKARRYRSSLQRPSWPPWKMRVQSDPKAPSDHPPPP